MCISHQPVHTVNLHMHVFLLQCDIKLPEQEDEVRSFR